ncbi:hypothetical protein TIFTF001_056650 [Ficus carica]|uniref:Uncharacterized protein n=1 Tax=Ficus carica TaxID=3494 RepID=A0AA88EKH3_FICCA|nr:hypothetical protein TIFTF001_056650 [Ficus carica]
MARDKKPRALATTRMARSTKRQEANPTSLSLLFPPSPSLSPKLSSKLHKPRKPHLSPRGYIVLFQLQRCDLAVISDSSSNVAISPGSSILAPGPVPTPTPLICSGDPTKFFFFFGNVLEKIDCVCSSVY